MIQDVIANQVKSIEPHDDLEMDHQSAVLAWIASGADLFRIKKPNVPSRHLVSYFAVVDPKARKLLLGDHLLAQSWIPTGGHVNPDENPIDTVKRECKKELGIEATFLGEPKPHFVSIAETINEPTNHIDVSLWFLLEADESTPLKVEKHKFAEVRWWDIDKILQTPAEQFGPDVHRFCNKLRAILSERL